MTAASRQPRQFDPPRDDEGRVRVAAEFGSRTFGLRQMQGKLSAPVFEKLQACIDSREPLDASIASAVAHAAKEWAIENGATHYCHWFQPLTGNTAEKHDAFLKIENGTAMERFEGTELIQSEPDASSFPSGGMRTTFEARGYTAWDPASPMFLLGSDAGMTLCIPSAFLSYHGHVLDEKTGLLRSNAALDTAVKNILATLGQDEVIRITSTLGAEQEYFLVDRALVTLRPDLLVSGRTVVGAPSTKGQQLDDHYFGSIRQRELAFIKEAEHELYQLGVPVKTRHNEVAPGQYESAPIFEEANVAADHNQLTMEIMRQVGRRHGFTVLFHEKPFAGINGTGKHLNWSLAAKHTEGHWENLFEPGETPEANLRFLLFTAAVLRTVQRHAGALRAAISGSGNDHRLGANEAPPAIISVFVGTTLTQIFDRLAAGISVEGDVSESVISLGVSQLPEVHKDNTDRNRTSPFAFTGNKWEFRACGGAMTISFPITVLNAAMADTLTEINGELRSRIEAGASPDGATLDLLQTIAKETTPIRFEGDNYAAEWMSEAESRGLLNLRKTSDALAWLALPENNRFLIRQKVFSDEEIQARIHVRTERYIMDLDIEYNALLRIVDTMILPAAADYLGMLARSVIDTKAAGLDAPQAARALEVSRVLGQLTAARDQMVETKSRIDTDAVSEPEHAHRYAYELSANMESTRKPCDRLEEICGDAWWPLPSYQELLFAR